MDLLAWLVSRYTIEVPCGYERRPAFEWKWSEQASAYISFIKKFCSVKRYKKQIFILSVIIMVVYVYFMGEDPVSHQICF